MGGLGRTLTGGSCRCAFQAGVLQALQERDIHFSVVSAVSSGAWNAAAVVTRSIHRLKEMWLGATRFPVYEAALDEGCEKVILIANNEDGSIFKNVRDRRHEIPKAVRDGIVLIHPSRPLPVSFNDLDRGRILDALDHGYEVGRTAAV